MADIKAICKAGIEALQKDDRVEVKNAAAAEAKCIEAASTNMCTESSYAGQEAKCIVDTIKDKLANGKLWDGIETKSVAAAKPADTAKTGATVLKEWLAAAEDAIPSTDDIAKITVDDIKTLNVSQVRTLKGRIGILKDDTRFANAKPALEALEKIITSASAPTPVVVAPVPDPAPAPKLALPVVNLPPAQPVVVAAAAPASTEKDWGVSPYVMLGNSSEQQILLDRPEEGFQPLTFKGQGAAAIGMGLSLGAGLVVRYKDYMLDVEYRNEDHTIQNDPLGRGTNISGATSNSLIANLKYGYVAHATNDTTVRVGPMAGFGVIMREGNNTNDAGTPLKAYQNTPLGKGLIADGSEYDGRNSVLRAGAFASVRHKKLFASADLGFQGSPQTPPVIPYDQNLQGKLDNNGITSSFYFLVKVGIDIFGE